MGEKLTPNPKPEKSKLADIRTKPDPLPSLNLLLYKAGELKVTDFGLGAVADGSLRHTLGGTSEYVPLENLSRRGYDPAKVDIWSCSVVLFVLAAGYLPFIDASLVNMYRKIYVGRFQCASWFSPARPRVRRAVALWPK